MIDQGQRILNIRWNADAWKEVKSLHHGLAHERDTLTASFDDLAATDASEVAALLSNQTTTYRTGVGRRSRGHFLAARGRVRRRRGYMPALVELELRVH